MLQLLLTAGALLLIFTAVLYLPGRLIVARLPVTTVWQLPLALTFGALCYAALLAVMLWLGLAQAVMAFLLRLCVLLSVAFALLLRKNLPPLKFPHPALFLWFCGYYLLAVVSAAFPDGSFWSASAETVRSLTGLPIDNIIPFNVARYIVEGIDPGSLDVVPDWSVTTRGPLAGMLLAVFQLLLGVSESAHWLSTTPGPFVLYHCLLVFLNLLVGLSVWGICTSFARPLLVPLALLILSSSAFFYLNIIFTWPKFFSAFLLLTGFGLWLSGERSKLEAVLTGLCLGAAVAAHDFAILYLPPFVLYAAYELGKRFRARQLSSLHGRHVRRIYLRELLLPPSGFVLGFLVILLPWQLFKLSLPDPQGARMLYLHLFCIGDTSLEGLTFLGALKRYLSENSLWDIIRIRLAGLWFPFDAFHAGLGWRTILFAPYRAATRFAEISFFQLIYALGIPVFAAALISLILPLHRGLRRFGLISLAAVIVAAVLFSCPFSTVNHVWAYPAFAVLTILAALAVFEFPGFGIPAVSFGVALNFVFLFFAGWLGESFSVLDSASLSFLIAQGCCGLTVLLSLLWAILGMEDR